MRIAILFLTIFSWGFPNAFASKKTVEDVRRFLKDELSQMYSGKFLEDGSMVYLNILPFEENGFFSPIYGIEKDSAKWVKEEMVKDGLCVELEFKWTKVFERSETEGVWTAQKVVSKLPRVKQETVCAQADEDGEIVVTHKLINPYVYASELKKIKTRFLHL